MKKILLFFSPLLLSGCLLATVFPNDYYQCHSLSGWCKDKPERQNYLWLFNYDHAEKNTNISFIDRREKDMRSCGMDPVIGSSDVPKINLCMEQKGWYLKGGPACEERTMWNRPLCIQWRAKHSNPSAIPWG